MASLCWEARPPFAPVWPDSDSAATHKMEKVLKTWSHIPKKINISMFQKPSRAGSGVDTVGLPGASPWVTGTDRADSQGGSEPRSHSEARSWGRIS